MRFLQSRPSWPLSELVDFFWFYDGLTPPHHLERVMPAAAFELIINLRDEPRHALNPDDLSRSRRVRGAWIAGMHSKPAIIDTAPDASMMGVHFRCGGTNLLLGLPACELADDLVETEQIWGRNGTELREQLLEATSVSSKFEILERFLLGKLRGKWGERTALNQAINVLRDAPEDTTVRNIAAEIGWSQKHLIDVFWQNVGMSPKRFSRVQRFQRAINGLQKSVPASWSGLALDCGYYDQAHFNAEFKHFSGLTPTAFMAASQGRTNFIPISRG